MDGPFYSPLRHRQGVPVSPGELMATPGGGVDHFSFTQMPGYTQHRGNPALGNMTAGTPMDDSPLVFQRTPHSPAEIRFESWMSSTSAYQRRALLKTPPTASMASVQGDLDTDNAPDSCVRASPAVSSVGLMKKWLVATDGTQWTPPQQQHRAAAAAAAAAGARNDQGAMAMQTPIMMDTMRSHGAGHTPLGIPMSLLGLRAAMPEGSALDSRAMMGGLAYSDGGEDDGSTDGEAATHAEPPADTLEARLHPAHQLNMVAAESAGGLDTPLARARGGPAPMVTPASVNTHKATAASAQPASPLEKVIDLMMEPPSPGITAAGAAGAHDRTPHLGRRASHAAAGDSTPASAVRRAKLGAAGPVREPLTPEEKVIELMLQGPEEDEQETAADDDHAGTKALHSSGAEAQQCRQDGSGGGDSSDEEGPYSEESEDEINVEELEAICAGAAGGGVSPIADIIGLVLATPRDGATDRGSAPRQHRAAAQAGAGDEGMGAGPRVLFADE